MPSVSLAFADDGTTTSSVGTFHAIEAFTLILGGGSNSITLGNYDDVITTTTGGHNVIHAGGGDNTLILSGASDAVDAGDGNDSIGITSVSATVDAGGGDDRISVYKAGQVMIDGGDGNDSLAMVVREHDLTFDQTTGKFSDGSSIENIESLDLTLEGKGVGSYTIDLVGAGQTFINVKKAPTLFNIDLSGLHQGMTGNYILDATPRSGA